MKSASGAPSAGQASALDRQRRATGFQRVPTYPVVAPMAPIAWQHAASSSGTAARRAHTSIAAAPVMTDAQIAQAGAAIIQAEAMALPAGRPAGPPPVTSGSTAAPLPQRLMPTPLRTGVLFCYYQQGHSRTKITHNITWLLQYGLGQTRQRLHATLKRWRQMGAHALPLLLSSVRHVLASMDLPPAGQALIWQIGCWRMLVLTFTLMAASSPPGGRSCALALQGGREGWCRVGCHAAHPVSSNSTTAFVGSWPPGSQGKGAATNPLDPASLTSVGPASRQLPRQREPRSPLPLRQRGVWVEGAVHHIGARLGCHLQSQTHQQQTFQHVPGNAGLQC